jgi:tryptophan synthase alpha chain
VTGARAEVAPEALRLLADVREVTQLPRAIGFGISRRTHVESLAGRAEAAVVGSALIDAIEASPADAAETVERFVRALGGLDTTGETAMPPA